MKQNGQREKRATISFSLPETESLFLPPAKQFLGLFSQPPLPFGWLAQVGEDAGYPPPLDLKTRRKLDNGEPVTARTARRTLRWLIRSMRKSTLGQPRGLGFQSRRGHLRWLDESDGQPAGPWLEWLPAIRGLQAQGPSVFDKTTIPHIESRCELDQRLRLLGRDCKALRARHALLHEAYHTHTLIDPQLIDSAANELDRSRKEGPESIDIDTLVRFRLWQKLDPILQLLARVEQDFLYSDTHSPVPDASATLIGNLLPIHGVDRLISARHRYFDHLANKTAQLRGLPKPLSVKAMSSYLPDPNPSRTRRPDRTRNDVVGKIKEDRSHQDAANKTRTLQKWLAGTCPEPDALLAFLRNLAGDEADYSTVVAIHGAAHRFDTLLDTLRQELGLEKPAFDAAVGAILERYPDYVRDARRIYR